MNAVIMDEVIIGEECIIGALTFIKSGENIPRRSMVAGNPGKIIKEVSDEMMAWKTEGTKLYQQLPAQCFESLRPVLPRAGSTELPSDPGETSASYKTWKSQSMK
jgi:carbonic anhydrase/acetyltransferase-like protein (isoleucine patch superfamily)